MWWQKTNGTDKKESLRVWTKTNIAVHKKQVIEWWCVGQNWVTSLCHPPFPGSVALERISSSASSVQRPKRVPCFFAATRMSVSPLERIYGCPFLAPFACLPMQSTARGFVVVVGQKSFIHNASFGRPWNSNPEALVFPTYKRGSNCKSGGWQDVAAGGPLFLAVTRSGCVYIQ